MTPSDIKIKLVEKPLHEQRLDICRNCDSKKDWVGKLFGEKIAQTYIQCGECGCLMNVKAKIKSMECPIGKWGKA